MRFAKTTTIAVRFVFYAKGAIALIFLTQVEKAQNKLVLWKLRVVDTEDAQVEVAIYLGVVSPGYDRSSPENGMIREFNAFFGREYVY